MSRVALVDRGDRYIEDSNPLPTLSIGSPLVNSKYDRIDVEYPTNTTEVYTYKNGSDTVGVVTVTYVDSTKERISSVVKV